VKDGKHQKGNVEFLKEREHYAKHPTRIKKSD